MSFKFNGTTITPNYTVKYNGTALKKIIYNGVTVWEPYYYIFKNGNTASSIFQGVRVNGFGLVKEYKWQSAGNVSNSGNNLVVKGNSGTYSSVFSINKINLSNYTKATIDVTALDNGSNGGEIRAGFTTSNADSYTGTYKTISKGTITIDISSLSGSHYLAFAIVGETKITISNIYLSK